MTFDQYWHGCTDGLPVTQNTAKVRAVAKLAWDAAHEHAAWICEDRAKRYGAFFANAREVLEASSCAESIRATTKGAPHD